MMTLDKFEEASEKVKEVVLPTNLIYSEYFSEQTGNKVYLKICSTQELIRCEALIIRSVQCHRTKEKKD